MCVHVCSYVCMFEKDFIIYLFYMYLLSYMCLCLHILFWYPPARAGYTYYIHYFYNLFLQFAGVHLDISFYQDTCTRVCTGYLYMYMKLHMYVYMCPEQSQNHGCAEKLAITFLASNFPIPKPIKSSAVTYIKSSFDVRPSATSLS